MCISRAIIGVIAFAFTAIAATAHAQSPDVGSINRTTPSSAEQAEWTLLVFMNGKNNLEEYAIADFLEMSKVGSSPEVNVAVQLGRLSSDPERRYGDWSGVKRFHLTKGAVPTPDASLEDLGSRGLSTDMGSEQTLADFITWGRTTFPAKRFMVVVWNHGQGWRLRALSYDPSSQSRTKKASTTTTGSGLGGFRSVSSDDEFESTIHNADLQKAIQQGMQGSPLDVIGFDACLMAMVETAYALRNSAKIMVGSEELEPGTGWNYELVLGRLTSSPNSSPEELAQMVVDAYRDHYGDEERTTLSAVALSRVDQLTSALNNLTASIQSADDITAARNARRPIKTYATSYAAYLKSSIDLGRWLTNLKTQSTDPKLTQAVDYTLRALNSAVIANYASKRMVPHHGSTGLAIFFPETTQDFLDDPDYEGYTRKNDYKPVAFVQETGWPGFLSEAFGLPTD